MGSATMVMPSFSIAAPCKPHIGSDLGGGTFFAAIPNSQCPALPAQHGIEFALSSAALAMRNGSAATKRHKKNRTPMGRILCLMCFIAAKTTEPILAGHTQSTPENRKESMRPRAGGSEVLRGAFLTSGFQASSCSRLIYASRKWRFDNARRFGRWWWFLTVCRPLP